ncbi:hypothetical protein F7725_000726 [Dissostichus mawsoni]|uniref:Death domain-containing protein n=1 Tax=Dissostichus mawsoni TaxID=36200 RepID=A0A7J5ZH68_DISMA|nr:hypothetical protein F7725_000726 [Dissostichus mawsoni]
MAEEPAAEIQLLRSLKVKLIEILSADADFVLQHAESRCLLSVHGYQQVKACRFPSDKGLKQRGLLKLLNEHALQETFPMLCFIKDLEINKVSSGIIKRKRETPDLQEIIPSKQICKKGSCLVLEKQLMTVARTIGRSWREIGRLALEISTVKIEQIEEDNSIHVERVFAMLRYWSTCQREKATAANLHSLLTDGQDPANLRDINEPLIDHSEGQLFLNEAFKIIVEEVLCKGTDVKQKVCEWKGPEDLALLLDLELRAEGEPQQRLLQRVKDVAKYSIKTSHPRFFNQLFAGVDYHALAGRFLSEALNTNLFTYEVAPVFVLMETEVLRSLRQLVGWTEGDGIFCPGGSTSNMFAMNLARYRLFPEVKSQGLWAVPRLTIFTSAESHYSVKKGAAFLGIGTDNIIVVKVDEGGRIIPEDLDEKIKLTKSQGAVPLLVSCTSGTTVRGAFDPLDRIADVCEKHNVWMHVDNLLKKCHSANATYLFQQDKFYDVNLDVGDKTVQCSRKVDCLKLWLMWKAVGSIGLGRACRQSSTCLFFSMGSQSF